MAMMRATSEGALRPLPQTLNLRRASQPMVSFMRRPSGQSCMHDSTPTGGGSVCVVPGRSVCVEAAQTPRTTFKGPSFGKGADGRGVLVAPSATTSGNSVCIVAGPAAAGNSVCVAPGAPPRFAPGSARREATPTPIQTPRMVPSGKDGDFTRAPAPPTPGNSGVAPSLRIEAIARPKMAHKMTRGRVDSDVAGGGERRNSPSTPTVPTAPLGSSVCIITGLPVRSQATPATTLRMISGKREGDFTGCSVSTGVPSCSVLDTPRTTYRSPSRSPGPDEVWGSNFVLNAGAHTRTGCKAAFPGQANQDAHLIMPFGETRMFVAVFDGHGLHGHICAQIVSQVFSQVAASMVPSPAPLRQEDVQVFMRRLFAAGEAALVGRFDSAGLPLALYSGTTATAALIDTAQGTLALAHVGDSTLMVTAGGLVSYCSEDHIVDATTELRVRARGGEVRAQDLCGAKGRRIFSRGSQYPGLMMSRSLGDHVAHNLGALSEPEVYTGLKFSPGNFLVLASDGVWDKVSKIEAAAWLHQSGSPQAAAMSLVEGSGLRWPADGRDDITAVVVGTAPVVQRFVSGPTPRSY